MQAEAGNFAIGSAKSTCLGCGSPHLGKSNCDPLQEITGTSSTLCVLHQTLPRHKVCVLRTKLIWRPLGWMTTQAEANLLAPPCTAVP